jgi:hypothetical protein
MLLFFHFSGHLKYFHSSRSCTLTHPYLLLFNLFLFFLAYVCNYQFSYFVKEFNFKTLQESILPNFEFLCFPIFIVEVECLKHKKYSPSLIAKNGKKLFYEEKSLVGLTPGHSQS